MIFGSQANQEGATASKQLSAPVTSQKRNATGGFVMKKMFVISLFMLATLVWAAAQQSGSTSDQSSQQPTSPSSQAPGASQTQPSTTPGAGQSQPSTPGASQSQPSNPASPGQAGAPGASSNAPITEGCLGGSATNYTITDKAGTTYKLNIPPNADASKLASHVGESVQVLGDVKGSGQPGASIDVQGIGRGTGKCPGSGSSGAAQPPPKQ